MASARSERKMNVILRQKFSRNRISIFYDGGTGQSSQTIILECIWEPLGIMHSNMSSLAERIILEEHRSEGESTVEYVIS
jgi:hypothetical protein